MLKICFTDASCRVHAVGAQEHAVEREPFECGLSERTDETLAERAQSATEAVDIQARRLGELIDGGEASRKGPALILDASNHDVCSREEIFGPVASAIRAGSHDEAVALANDTEFGPAAGIVARPLASSTMDTSGSP